MKLMLDKFDISSIADDRVVVMIGKRNTGKSFLVKDLLYHNNNFKVGTVISGTESSNGFYSKIVPKIFIHDEYKPEIIDKIIQRQKMVIKQRNKDIETFSHSSVDPRSFLILDDCLYDNSWINDKNIRSLFMNGRHLKMFFLITMQYPLGIPPNLRTNIDYVFILRENYRANRKRIYENFAGMFDSFESFCQVMDQCTEDYECLVIDNTTKSNKLEDNIFWYKAQDHNNVRLCSEQFWEMSKNIPDDEDNEQNYDPSVFRKKKPVINVKKTYKR